MRFGLFTSMGAQTYKGVLDLWQHLEATGWDIACVTDHFMPNTKEREGAMLEAWSTLSALAAVVPRMRVGTIVLGIEGTGWDIGHAVRFLCSAHARYITGQTLVVDGGATLVGPARESQTEH